eukprot:TRINITY_DN7322_c0_g3_i1.p2 TRINITY_DN7322_c0_g3~~TRINITY_DN7322_c0_g3_i1.p2  ORF type:complete len:152 (-),score=25.44 TRINITY_DN7322_c0_g3_i1:502-957(-)
MDSTKSMVLQESSPFGVIVTPTNKECLKAEEKSMADELCKSPDEEEVVFEDSSTAEENVNARRKLTFVGENYESQELTSSLLDSIIRSRKSFECFDHNTPRKFEYELVPCSTVKISEHAVSEAYDLFSMDEAEKKVSDICDCRMILSSRLM